jgi:hypothetical protein
MFLIVIQIRDWHISTSVNCELSVIFYVNRDLFTCTMYDVWSLFVFNLA